jgi:hypothetical protein
MELPEISPVPQADGYSDSGTKVYGKKYTILNRAYGPCPECYARFRPAPAAEDILGEYIHAAGCLFVQSEGDRKIEESGNLSRLPEGSH